MKRSIWIEQIRKLFFKPIRRRRSLARGSELLEQRTVLAAQFVSATPGLVQGVAPGEDFDITVQYTSFNDMNQPADIAASGGVVGGVFFDSSKLQFNSVSNLFLNGLVDGGVIADVNNLDGDASTNSIAYAVWSSLPGAASPLNLVDVNFTALTDFTQEDINFAIDPSVGFGVLPGAVETVNGVFRTANISVQTTGDGNGTFASAVNLGTFSAEGTTSADPDNTVGDSDPIDRFKFTLAEEADGSLEIAGPSGANLTGALDVYLYDANGNILVHQVAASGGSLLLEGPVAAGTYFIGIQGAGANVAYEANLEFDFEDEPPVDTDPDDNATFATAFSLGSISEETTITLTSQSLQFLSVGTSDPVDGFRFTTTVDGSGSVTLGGLSQNADLFVYDVNGNLLVSSQTGGTAEEVLAGPIPAGTYYIGVVGRAADTTYTLGFNFEPEDDGPSGDPDGNGTFATALNLGSFSENETIEINPMTNSAVASVGTSDSLDLFKFTTTADGTGSLELDGLSADADVVVYDAAGNVLVSSANDGTAGELLQGFIPAGTYFIGVFGAGANTTYSLSLEVFPPQATGEFDGDYVGTFSGSVNALGTTIAIPSSIVPNNILSVTISGGVLTAELEGIGGLGSGAIDVNGQFGSIVSFEAFDIEVTVLFTGSFDESGGSGTFTIIDTPGITGSGTWTVSAVVEMA